MTPAQLSDLLVISTIALHVFALLAYAAWTAVRVMGPQPLLVTAAGDSVPVEAEPDGVERGERTAAAAHALTMAAVMLNLAAVVARGVAAGRPPWGNMFEFALVAALTAGVVFVGCARRWEITGLGVWLTALILVDLGLAVTVLATPVSGLVPVLNSYWLAVHVAAAIIAGGIFTVGAVATGLSFARGRLAATFASSADLRRFARAAHVAAFPIWTFAVIAGAIWAENAWGRYWGWDPKETWAFITWVFYAAYLHADATPGRWGRRASWFALAGYAAFLFNFFGVNIWIPGLHSYA